MKFIDQFSWLLVIAGTLTLGLAPFTPEPHLFQKVTWLFRGDLYRPIDIFDLFLHGAFPLLLVVKSVRALTLSGTRKQVEKQQKGGEGNQS